MTINEKKPTWEISHVGFSRQKGKFPFWVPSMDITESNARREGCLERSTRLELVSIAWKATAQPIYQERLTKMKWSLNITPQLETAFCLG